MHFEMTAVEVRKAAEWMGKHHQTCKYLKPGAQVGAIGGVLTYSFTPSTLGRTVEISCACGEKQNVTDFSDW